MEKIGAHENQVEEISASKVLAKHEINKNALVIFFILIRLYKGQRNY